MIGEVVQGSLKLQPKASGPNPKAEIAWPQSNTLAWLKISGSSGTLPQYGGLRFFRGTLLQPL